MDTPPAELRVELRVEPPAELRAELPTESCLRRLTGSQRVSLTVVWRSTVAGLPTLLNDPYVRGSGLASLTAQNDLSYHEQIVSLTAQND